MSENDGVVKEKRNQVSEGQQNSVDIFLLKDDNEGVAHHSPDIEADITKDQNGVRFEVLENMVGELAVAFYKHREADKAGPINYPRVEVLVDKNCLLTYTGPIEDFDQGYFQSLLDQTIRGRLEMDDNVDDEDIKKVDHNLPYVG